MLLQIFKQNTLKNGNFFNKKNKIKPNLQKFLFLRLKKFKVMGRNKGKTVSHHLY